MSNESPSFGTELSQEIMTCLFIPHGTTLNMSDGIRIPICNLQWFFHDILLTEEDPESDWENSTDEDGGMAA